MYVMLAAFAVTILIAFAADYALDELDYSSEDRNAGANVRLE